MTDIETPVQIPETVADEQILKPKRQRKPYDPAVREKMAENMRRINAERLEKARIRSEQNLDKKQEEIMQKAQKKLDAVSKKKAVVQKIKEEKGIPESKPEPEPEPEPKPKSAKRSKKQVIVELSSESETDSDSSSSSDEEDIIYVSKKKPRKKSKKDRSIVKPKQNKKPKSIPEQDSHPKTIIKFI
jgi:hypothetical protein